MKRTKLKTDVVKILNTGNRNDSAHPEDRRLHVSGRKYARVHGVAFIAEHQLLIEQLVTVYADDAASSALERLREAFWSGEWQRAREGEP